MIKGIPESPMEGRDRGANSAKCYLIILKHIQG
jgi:hypothetical protein